MKNTIRYEVLEIDELLWSQENKRTWVSLSIKNWFQRIKGDIWALFDHIENLAHWNLEQMLIPSWDPNELHTHNRSKPKFINSKQLHWKFYFYNFWWNKDNNHWVALLLDDDWKRVYKKREAAGISDKKDQFIDLNNELRTSILNPQDIDDGFILWLRSNWRKGFN